VLKYRAVTAERVQKTAQTLFASANCSTLYYLKEK
jgi:hypothetical protein